MRPSRFWYREQFSAHRDVSSGQLQKVAARCELCANFAKNTPGVRFCKEASADGQRVKLNSAQQKPDPLMKPSNYNEGSSPAALCGRRPRGASGSSATHHGQRLGRGLLPQPDPPLSSHRHLASTCAWGNPSACFQPSVSQFSLLARCISEAAAEPSAAFCAAQLGVPQKPFPGQVMKSAGFHSALTTSISFSPVPRHTSGFSAGRICLVSHYPA